MVAKFLELNNFSWHRRPFALSKNGRKVWPIVLFLSATIYRKVINVNFFVFFFVPYLQEHGLLRSKNLATMATWREDFSSLLGSTYNLQISVSMVCLTIACRAFIGSRTNAGYVTIFVVKFAFCAIFARVSVYTIFGFARIINYRNKIFIS